MKKFFVFIIIIVFLSSCEQDKNIEISGYTHNNEYVNNYFSFNLVLDDGWQFLTDEQITKLTAYERADLEKEGKLLDMMAIELESKDNIQVYFEKLGDRKKNFLNADSALDLIKEINVKNENLQINEDIKKEKIASQEYFIVKSQASGFYKDYLLRLEDEYIFIFSITYKEPRDFEKIVSMIKK